MVRLTNAVASAIAQFQAGQPQSSSHHSASSTITQSNQAINLAMNTPHFTLFHHTQVFLG